MNQAGADGKTAQPRRDLPQCTASPPGRSRSTAASSAPGVASVIFWVSYRRGPGSYPEGCPSIFRSRAFCTPFRSVPSGSWQRKAVLPEQPPGQGLAQRMGQKRQGGQIENGKQQIQWVFHFQFPPAGLPPLPRGRGGVVSGLICQFHYDTMGRAGGLWILFAQPQGAGRGRKRPGAPPGRVGHC